MRKVIRTKKTLLQRNQEINTATRIISINLGNLTVIQKNKTTFDVVVVEAIRNEDTEERRQSRTVIVSYIQETDRDHQSNGEDAKKFLFHGQGATRTDQTNRHDSIRIKEADKGGALVVMNKTHYYNMVVKFLQGEKHIKKPMKIVTEKFSKTFKNLLPNLAIVY